MDILAIDGHAEHETWNQFVHHCPLASQYHLSGWQQVLESSYGNKTVYLAASVDGQICGVLPLALVRGYPSARHLASLPYLSWAGMCAEDSKTADALLHEANTWMKRLKANYVELHNTYQVGSPAASLSLADWNESENSNYELSTNTDKVNMRLGLTDSEAMWAGLSPKVRNQVRKAMKSGLRVEACGVEALDDFYDAFATNMRDLGSPVHSKGFFRNIFRTFREDTRLFMIYSDSETVGGAILIRFRNTAEVPWASCKREYFSSCPNHLLYWEIIKSLCESGVNAFDFGRSSRDSGTFRFKKQWGANPEPLYWQYISSAGSETPSPESPSLRERALIETWKRLPVGMTKALGPTIRKRFSA